MVALPDIRAGERRNVAGAFLTLFGVLAAHLVTETARDALFLSRLPVHHLPWVYIAIAFIAAFIARPRGGGRRVGRNLIGLWLVASAVITTAFWALATPDRPWTLYVLYGWSGVFGTLTLTWFWLLLGELFTVTEAKRLYGAIGAGAVLGAVAGAGLASALATVLPARHLLLAAAALLLLTAAIPSLLLRRPAPDEPAFRAIVPRPDMGHCASTVMRQPYIKRLAGLVIVSTITLSLVDYVFKATVAAEIPAAELTTWLAGFYLALNLAALVAQVLLTGAIMRRFGVHRALLVLPLLIVGGGLGLLVGAALVGALVLKGADGSLRHSLHRTSTELLYLPIPERLRRQTKAFIDVLLQRGAQALASLAILAALALGADLTVLAAAASGLAVLWLIAAVRVRPHYIEMFRQTLREGSIETRPEVRELDLSSLEALIRALNHDDAEVLGAMELLAREGRTSLIPALILHHPSEEVVLRALQHFTADGGTAFVPVADRLLSDPRPTIRAAALRARHAVAPDAARLRAQVADPSALVRTTALALLLFAGALEDAEARAALGALRRLESVDEHVAALTAIALVPAPRFVPIVLELAARPEPAVQLAAADAMGALASAAVLPRLVAMLGRASLRPRARAAILRHGDRALAYLRAALADEALDAGVRVHLPRTISRFRNQTAANILLARLRRERQGNVRFKILRGLGRLAADDRRIALDGGEVHAALADELEVAFRLLHWGDVLAAAPAGASEQTCYELLVTLVRDKQEHAVERVFRLLALAHRAEDFEPIYRSRRSGSRTIRATGLELLENVVHSELREAVLALVSDRPVGERLAAGDRFHQARPVPYTELVVDLAAGGGSSLAMVAAYHARELGLVVPARPAAVAEAEAERRPGLLEALVAGEPVHAG